MRLKTIKEAAVAHKRVLVRVDYNVSVDKDSNIADNMRILQTLPTINYLRSRGAKIILASHFGRPQGKPDKQFSLSSVAKMLGKHLKSPVRLLDKFWTKAAINKTKTIASGEVILLENTRFHPGEMRNDRLLARHLAAMADIFVNDAFGSSHRAHASIVGVAKFLPAYAGLLLLKEVNLLDQVLSKNRSKRGKLCIIIGGAKTPEKIRVIESLLGCADEILLGGAVANTFLSTWGLPTGCSLVDYEMIETARQIIWKATQSNSSLLLPVDVVVSNSNKSRLPTILDYRKVPGHLAIFDIGPKTIRQYREKIARAKRVIWNGPMGVFEERQFANGTQAMLDALCAHTGTTIIGGGDTLAAIQGQKLAGKISHISTGGGALLTFLEKGTLPGIEIVKNGQKKNYHHS